MKLNEDYTKLTKDVIAEIDFPPQGQVGRLMVNFGYSRGCWLSFTLLFEAALRLAAIWEATQVTADNYATDGRV